MKKMLVQLINLQMLIKGNIYHRGFRYVLSDSKKHAFY